MAGSRWKKGREEELSCALSAHSLPNYLLLQESPGDDLSRESAIRAEATIPGKNFRLRMTFRRNTDKTLPASHIVEMIFLKRV